MRRRIILGVILLVVLVAAVRLVRTRKQQLMSQRVITPAALTVATGVVTRGNFQGSLVCYGTVESDRQAEVRARTGGQVSRFLAREGDAVEAGRPLLELDGTAEAPSGSRAAVATAVANLERSVAGMERTVANLKATLDNDSMLREHDAISAQQLETSQNRWEEARIQLSGLRSELAAQRRQLSYFTITAPFDGVVAALHVELGDVVTPNQPLVKVENASPCRVRATVAAADLGRIRTGGPVTLAVGEWTLPARVGRIHPSAGPAGTGTVDILLDEPPFGLPLGAGVEVRLAVDSLSDVLLVPAAAVLTGAHASRVHVVQADTVRVVPVEVLARSGEQAAVAGDLAPRDVLVLGSDSLLMRLADGVRVAPRKVLP